jgi:hypothetical protein
VGTSQTLTLTTASADGAYTVTATQGSCTTPVATYTYNKQNILQTYTILAFDEDVNLGQYNTVLHGSVGNTDYNAGVIIGANGTVASTGAFVKGSYINVTNPSNVPTRIIGFVTVTLPTMLYNTASLSGLHNITISANGTYSGNYYDVTVKPGIVATLTGSIFHNITIQSAARVTFTSATVNLNELTTSDGSSASPTKVIFSTDCVIKAKDKVQIGKYNQVNPTSKSVVFYVDGDDFHVYGKGTTVRASVYAPTMGIVVDGDNSVNCYMTGRFIANVVTSTGKHVIWDNFDCANPPAPMFTAEPVYTLAARQSSEETVSQSTESVSKSPAPAEVAEKLEVKAYPNPSSSMFNLKLKAPQLNQEVVIRLVDMTGRVMQQVKGTPEQIFQVGGGLLPGTYLAEVMQGTERITVKLIKQ